jgi:hypothetical protein
MSAPPAAKKAIVDAKVESAATSAAAIKHISSEELIKYIPKGVIEFGGNVYDIRYTEADRIRRTTYFTAPNGGELTKGEVQILKDLGISLPDKEKANSLFQKTVKENVLVQFFEELPYCQSTSALTLSAKCLTPKMLINKLLAEVAYRQQLQYQEDLKKPLISLDTLAKQFGMIRGLGSAIAGLAAPLPSVTSGPSAEKLKEEDEAMYRFFELRLPA